MPPNCSMCRNGVCQSGDACHQPERRDFRPTYELRGPYRRLRRFRLSARVIAGICGLAAVLVVVFLFLFLYR